MKFSSSNQFSWWNSHLAISLLSSHYVPGMDTHSLHISKVWSCIESSWTKGQSHVGGSPQLKPGKHRIWTCGKQFCFKVGLFPVSGCQMWGLRDSRHTTSPAASQEAFPNSLAHIQENDPARSLVPGPNIFMSETRRGRLQDVGRVISPFWI